eukprot:gnl/Carplike_NY0171/157_a230_3775.p1 GENE.gnl/Carplike_NY0171/157_a230_3775~~gnl/Carplike_NY0171/157_a230_3775.p1  ORF type:complete len:207 (+),score=56.33 gnl/Carplike_NY0171/157_a230_3775:113-733(+)
MPYTLEDFPWPIDALEPHYPKKVIEIHRLHHKGYCTKSQAALEGTKLEGKPIEYVISHLEELPVGLRQKVKNVGGGYANHTFFWKCLSPKFDQPLPAGLKAQVEKDFGSVDEMWKIFSGKLSTLFGSGWTWMVFNTKTGKLEIMNTANQDSPINDPKLGLIPVLAIDSWEHAWYLYCQNRKPEYVEHVSHMINWEFVDRCLTAAKK